VSHPQFQSSCTAEAIDSAAAHLMSGDLVAFPTETVYGLGADACNSKAVAKIYEVKGRPVDHPLIVHIASLDSLGDWAREIPEYAIKLARDFWPGPMTLVLKRSELAGDFVTGGQDTVGVRVPDHAVALSLLTAFEKVGGRGVAAPSANRFGHVSSTNAAAVNEELGQYLSENDIILDGGACDVGVESTIIDCTGPTPRILRPGAISELMVNECTGFSCTEFRPQTNTGEEIRVSGSLESHYAPAAKVFLDHTPLPGQGFIADAKLQTPEGVIRLASPVNDDEFARLLYAALRAADAQGLAEVVVAQPNGAGIAVAIRDRLARAANGR
jgi:L-threonylcarbamoyladenylate synthase